MARERKRGCTVFAAAPSASGSISTFRVWTHICTRIADSPPRSRLLIAAAVHGLLAFAVAPQDTRAAPPAAQLASAGGEMSAERKTGATVEFGSDLSPAFTLYLGLRFHANLGAAFRTAMSSPFYLDLGVDFDARPSPTAGEGVAQSIAIYLAPVHEAAAQSTPFALDTWSTQPLDLLSPPDALAVTSDAINFVWSNMNADYYEIWVDDDADFSSPELQPRFLAPNNLDRLPDAAFSLGGGFLAAGREYSWRVRAHAGEAWVDSPARTFVYAPAPSPEPIWAPLYRLYKPADTDHFYTTNEGQITIAEGSLFRRERVEGFVSTRRVANAAMGELFRFYDAQRRCHFYTMDSGGPSAAGLVDSLISAGLLYEGVAGYIWHHEQPGLVPLYRVSSVDDSDHLMTVSAVEVAQIPVVWPGQFELPEVVGWVSANGDTPLVLNNLWAATVGEGISPGSGNFQHYEQTSFSLPGHGPPLEFEHIYNSRSVHLASQTMPLGPGWNHTYGASVSAVAGLYLVAWPDGNIHRYDQGTARCLDDSIGVYDQLTDLGGGTVEIRKKDQVVYTFSRPTGAPDEYPLVLTSIRDRNQNSVALEYETDGLRRLVWATDSVGRRLEFAYRNTPGFQSQLVGVTDFAGGRSVEFSYEDTNGNLTSFTNCAGQTTRYYYDSGDTLRGQNHELTRIQLPRGNIIDNTYAERRVTGQRTSTGAGSLSMSYGPRQATARTSAGSQNIERRYTFTAGGLIERVETVGMPGSVAVQRTDSRNPALPTWIQDERGYVTSYAYDSRGNVLAVHRSTGSERFEYDTMNNVTRAVDGNGRSTTFTYDGRGNLISVIDPLGRATTMARTATGALENVLDPMGHQTRYYYDGYGNLSRISDPLNQDTLLEGDAAGRLLRHVDAGGRISTYSYDCANHVEIAIDPGGGSTQYDHDGNGNLTRVTDPLGHATQWGYHPELDIVVSVTNAVGDATTYSYNADGSLARLSLPTGTINYSYDSDQRLTYISSNSASLQHDAAGNVIGAHDPNGMMSMTYDAAGRLTSQTDYYNNTVGYSYDAAGNLVRIAYPGGRAVNYTYNSANELMAVTDWNGHSTSYAYNADGALTGVSYPNGAHAEYLWDAAGRLVGLEHVRAGGGPIATYAFTVAPTGEILTEDRVEPFTAPAGAAGDVPITLDAANRITTAGPYAHRYDGSGNLIWRAGPSPLDCTYDLAGRMTAMSGSANASFTYDPFGNRWAAARDGTVVRYVLDLHGPMSRLLMEVDDTGAPTAYYIHGIGLIARIGADGQSDYGYYHCNQVGSVVAISAEDGSTITGAYSYSPFGEVLATTAGGADRNPFRFGGFAGVMAESDGLYFMRARYFDSWAGRFLSEDPEWSTNLYAYADNSPLVRVDPDGHRSRRAQGSYRAAAQASLRSTWVMMRYVGTLGLVGGADVPFWGKVGYAVAMDIGEAYSPGLKKFRSKAKEVSLIAKGATGNLSHEDVIGYGFGKAYDGLVPRGIGGNTVNVLFVELATRQTNPH